MMILRKGSVVRLLDDVTHEIIEGTITWINRGGVDFLFGESNRKRFYCVEVEELLNTGLLKVVKL